MNRWPLHKAWFWETAPFFRVLLPFAAGIFCYYMGWGGGVPGKALLAVTVTSFVVLCVAELYGRKKRINVFITIIALHLFLFISGYFLSYLSDVTNNPSWFGNNLDKSSGCVARITATPVEKERTWKLNVELLYTTISGHTKTVNGDALVYMSKGLHMYFQKGDTILLPGNWQSIKNAGNPFEFDYAGYCKRNNLVYRQFCLPWNVRLLGAINPAALPVTEKVHDWCMSQLARYFPDRKTQGLIQAMLLGDEVNLDEDLRQSYTDTGIVHVIAISGGNVMLFFTFIGFLLWWVKHKKHEWIKFLIALPLVWFYVIMAGSSPSAIRAAFMFTLLAVGRILDKNNNSLNQLFAAAFLLLCAQPNWLFSVGFQLSFVAVLSLILFYGPIYKLAPAPQKWKRFKTAIWKAISASLAAEILAAPLVMYYFHNFPLLFLIANLLAFLFMECVLFAGIAVILLSWVPLLPGLIGTLTTGMVALFDRVVVFLQQFNPPSFHFLLLTLPEMLVLYLALAGIGLFLIRKNRPALLVAMGAICLFTGLLCRDKWTSLRQYKLVVYNSGKQNHIEIISGNEYSAISTDTTELKKNEYAIKPAHTHWQAWQHGPANQREVVQVGSTTLLVLNSPVKTPEHFPADIVIINYKGPVNVKNIKAVFAPKLVVIGNNYGHAAQEEWIRVGKEAGIALHVIARDGAFVLDADQSTNVHNF